MTHVLVLPSFLDCKWGEGGTFFREQAGIMHRFANWKINMLMPCAQHVMKIKRRKLPSANGIEMENMDGVEIWFGYYPYYLPRKTRQAWQHFGEKLFCAYLEKHGMPDYLWVQAIPNAGYLAQHLRRKYGVPYFIHEHVAMYRREKISRFASIRIKNIINDSVYCAAVGESLRLDMLRQTGVKENEISVIHNPVGLEFIDFAPAPRQKSPFIFVSAAHLRSDKNIDVIIRAFAAIFTENPDCRLLIVGGGKMEESLHTLASDLGISDSVVFTGMQNRKQVCKHLTQADAYVHTSGYETFGLAIVEAMTCGLPVVTTKVGVAEQIINDSNGIFADFSVDSTITAMREVMRRDYSSATIRESALEQFSPQTFASRVQNMLG